MGAQPLPSSLRRPFRFGLLPAIVLLLPPSLAFAGPHPSIPTLEARLAPGAELRDAHDLRATSSRIALEPAPEAPGELGGFAGQEVILGDLPSNEELSQLQQAAAPLPGGGYGVVWNEGISPDRDVRMQWLSSAGSFVFPPDGVTLAGAADENEFDAAITAHPTAGAYVAFVRQIPGVTGQIIVQRFSATGVAQWPGVGVGASDLLSGEQQGEPQLLANPSGGVFACFSTFVFFGGPNYDIRCQLLDESGARQWGALGTSVGGVGLRVLPRMAPDGGGGLLAFWRNQRDPFTDPVEPMLMEGQRFSPAGTRMWGEEAKVVRQMLLSDNNAHTLRFFQVASDGSGGAVLAFDDWTGSTALGLDVVAQRVAADGTLLWGNGQPVAATDVWEQHEMTLGTGDGGAIVGIVEFPEADGYSRLRLFRLAPDGSPLWGVGGLSVSTPLATGDDFNLTGALRDGVLRVGWTQQNIPATFDMDVRMAAYTLAGQRIGGDVGVAMGTAPDGQFLYGLVSSPGSTLAVWDDRRSGSWDDMHVVGATVADAAWIPHGDFFTAVPCRLVDTRLPAGPFGGPALTSGQPRSFAVRERCALPVTAKAVAVNVTVVAPSGTGFVVLHPADIATPLTSSLNFAAGQVRGNNGVYWLSLDGALTVTAQMVGGGQVHVLLDVAGYFD